MSSPASKRVRLSASRTSLSGRSSLQGNQSALPRPISVVTASRLANTQPTYDLFSGGQVEEQPQQPFKRSTLRQSQVFKQDSSHDENLRARINSLEYELKNTQQERSLLVLQHEKELRDSQAKADADYKKYQTAEGNSKKASQKYDSLARELRDAEDRSINEKATLERRIRDLQEQNASLKEDIEDAQGQLSDQERQYKYQINDIESKRAALQENVDKFRKDLDRISQEFDATQARLAERDVQVEGLEAQIIELKSHTDDREALGVVQRELSEQVAHIRKLELTNREQVSELRKLREGHRSVQVVEEQKHGLENQLEVLKDVHRQLGEAQIQKEILEDEKRTWTSLLDGDGQQNEFQSPEEIVKALIQERIEHASVMDRLGNTETELLEKDELIKSLETEKSALTAEMEKSKTALSTTAESAPASKAYKRLERQRVLAMKEVEYLRAQIKTFDIEETVLMDNQNFDSQRSQQVQQLEALVDQYKAEIQTLHDDLSKREASTSELPTGMEPRGIKRPVASLDLEEDDSHSQLGPLLRKNKNLQIALQKTSQQSQYLATELQATKSQLKSLRASSKTRILELRDNPTANAEAFKMSTLTTLKAENVALLAQLRGEDLQGIKVVPISSVDHLKLDLQEMEKVVAEKEKRMRRLREIWTDKAAEFRDVIASILGYRVTFLPNGKVKVGSMFYSGRKEAGDEQADDEENFIMFDGEKGTMKISGGNDGAFGKEIKELVEFWVKGRKEIPCFLAAMTLEFYEKFGLGASGTS